MKIFALFLIRGSSDKKSFPLRVVSIYRSIALDKMFFFVFFFQSKSIDVFLISSKRLCCGYSLEASHFLQENMLWVLITRKASGASNDYLQYMFLW